ncbi:uncharacterized protein LOC144548110, partial [Carex rostrata]
LEEKNFTIDRVRICYSPFSRTTETAREVARVLGISIDSSSCKVSFICYAEVWALYEKNHFMPPEGSESVADVASRLRAALLATETAFQGYSIAVFFFLWLKLLHLNFRI